ncbi:MAG: hypothetical protein QOI53_1576 [Verrucomicrobiota bacterium]|nr:hypothetical protein [Verrucomicrobiota bacterium]
MGGICSRRFFLTIYITSGMRGLPINEEVAPAQAEFELLHPPATCALMGVVVETFRSPNLGKQRRQTKSAIGGTKTRGNGVSKRQTCR